MKQLMRQPTDAAAVLFLAALALVRLISLPETDVLFSIRHGQDILAGGAIAAPDTWNFQTAGEVWISNSWLWDVVLGAAYSALGLIGISLLNGLTFVAALALAWSISSRLGVLGLRRALLLGAFGLTTVSFFSARAVSIDLLLPLTYAWILLLLRERAAGWRFWALLAPLTLALSAVGMNLHLSAPAYGLLLPSLSLMLLPLRSWLDRAKAFFGLGITVAIGVLLTPYGIEGFTKSGQVAAASRKTIVEWNGPDLKTVYGWISLGLLLACCGVIGWLAWRKRYGSATLLLALTLLSFEAVRFTIYALCIAFVSAVLLLAAENTPLRLPSLTAGNRRLLLALCASAVLGCAGLVAFTYSNPNQMTQVDPNDYAAFAPSSRILSSPSEGSAIILYRKDLQVAVDGRNDLLGAKRYGEAVNVFGYYSKAKLKAWLDEHGVDGAFTSAGQQDEVLGKRFIELGWRAHPGVYGVAYTR